MSTKFFVFGGGRWRELCLETGTVSGWNNSARFLYKSGRRLQVARRRGVLAGLRALAAGLATCVRNGQRLTQCRQGSFHSRKREFSPVTCTHCCKYGRNTKVIELPTTSASVVKQTQTDDTVQVAKPVLRSAEKDCEQTRARSGSASQEYYLDKISKRVVPRRKVSKKSRQSIIKYRHSSESSDNSVELSQSKLRIPSHQVTETRKSASPKELKGKSTSTESLVIVPKTSYKTRNSRKAVRIDSKNTSQQRKGREDFISKIIEGNLQPPSRPVSAENNKTNYKKRTTRGKVSSRALDHLSGTESSEWSGAPSLGITPSLQRDRDNNICKELTVEESDVIALRTFLERNSSEEVLLKFDSDDAYKQRIFYSINPLVRLERCPRTTELLSRHLSNARLADFASQLGLRSVSDSSLREPGSYRTRRSLANTQRRKALTSDHEDTDKENLTNSRIDKRGAVPGPSSNLRTRISTRVLGEKSPEKTKVPQKVPEPLRVDSVIVSSDSDDVFVKKSSHQKNSLQKSSQQKNSPQKNSQQKSSQPKTVEKKLKLQPTLKVSRRKYLLVRGYRKGMLEYSTLEDQAIVSWVSQGGRANRVKGNMLWRELYDQYYALTGQNRTWQSLRNRYLRYVLPALGQFSLPPGRAAALRSAAATGEIKTKTKLMKRNSIFDRTEVEAASTRAPERRVRPPLHSEHSDSDRVSSPPRKRLRSSAGGRSGRVVPEPEAAPATRTRKLFNLNTVL